MRAMTKALVSVTTAVGIAAGGLATAGTSFAAPTQDTKAVASAEAVAPLAVVNLGLNATQAKGVQRWLRAHWSYTDSIDGELGPNSWKAFQRMLKAHHGYTELGQRQDAVGLVVRPVAASQQRVRAGGLRPGGRERGREMLLDGVAEGRDRGHGVAAVLLGFRSC
ncbi:hypothetical protein SHIRM173S_09441 [Streptomyces hirsutus]